MIEITDRQTIQKQIIPLLFYERSAKKLLPLAQEYFSKNHINVNSLQDKFKKLEETKDKFFWKEIIKILSEIYETSLDTETLLELLSHDFEKFIKKLLIQRFEYEFSTLEIDNKMTTDIDNLKKILHNEEHALSIDDNGSIYIFYPTEKKETGNVEPLTPGERIFYPTLLIKMEEKKKKIYFGGGKRERNKILKKIEEKQEDIFKPEEITEFNDFSLIPSQMFLNLPHHNIYIKGIKIKDPYFNMNVHSKKDFIELNTFINLELILSYTRDLLKISEIELIYLKKLNNKLEEIPFKLSISKEKQSNSDKTERFFQFKLNITSRKKNIDTLKIQNKIIGILNNTGIEINKPYNMPTSYFFKRFISEKDEFQKGYFDIIREIRPGDSVIDQLIKKGIINDTEKTASFDIDKFIMYVKNMIATNLVGKSIDKNDEKFEILKAEKEKNNIILRVKIYSDQPNSKFTKYHRIRIPLKSRVSSKDKIYYIILSDLDYYLIIDAILQEKHEDAIRHIHIQLKNYILYQYGFILEKEAYNSYNIIRNFIKNPSNFQGMDEKKFGNILEQHSNVLLKYLFGNYLAYGGRNKPDGYLSTENQNYIIDCKIHKQIKISEYRKLRSYMENFCNNEKLPETKNGILIISEKLIKTEATGSLNWEAKKQIFKSTDYNIGFVSLEYIVRLYEVYKENLGRFKKPELIKKLFESFDNAFSNSLDVDNIDILENLENEIIHGLIKELERDAGGYLPLSEKEGL